MDEAEFDACFNTFPLKVAHDPDVVGYHLPSTAENATKGDDDE
jgi:hypothetical protein